MTTYDSENVFAKILRGELPAAKVFEDDDVLVIMDAMPQSEGHTLVIPKTPARNLLDAETTTVAKVFTTAQHIASAIKTAFKADGIVISQFNEAAAGQTVFHLHVHIIPRFNGVDMRPHASVTFADPQLLAEQAERIRAVL